MTEPTITEAVVPATAGDVAGRCKAAFLPILRAHGIARVTIGYNGEGDEGQVHEIAGWTEAGDPVDLPPINCARHQLGFDGAVASDVVRLQDALDSFAVEALCSLHGGWEDNSGSCGEIEIMTVSGEVTLTHNWRIETFDTVVSEL